MLGAIFNCVVGVSHYDEVADKDKYLNTVSSSCEDLTSRLFTSTVPHEFTSVPFPVKALKILLHDLQSGGDSATISAQGETFEVDSDGVSCISIALPRGLLYTM